MIKFNFEPKAKAPGPLDPVRSKGVHGCSWLTRLAIQDGEKATLQQGIRLVSTTDNGSWIEKLCIGPDPDPSLYTLLL